MIYVTAARDVATTIAAQQVDAVLSIEHPGATDGAGRAPRLDNIPQKILSFWDIEDETATNGPSSAMVLDGFEFLDHYKYDNVIVHCHAGRSRSVAMTLGWMARDYGITPAIDAIKDQCTAPAPNMAVIRLVDEMYDFGGTLIDAVENDPDFTANRAKTEERRQEIAANNPDLIRQIYPEKFNLG